MANFIKLVVESTKSISRKIVKVLRDAVNTRLFTRAPKIQIDIRKLIEEAIKRQPEYRSLLGGKLQSELGVVNTSSRLDKIIRIIVDSIEVDVLKAKDNGSQIVAGLKINLVKTNFEELVSLPEASYMTEKGVVIQWLKWLLLEGDKIIVRDYMIGIDKKGIYARTGLGEIMIPSGKKATGWRVPPEFAGTAENNFITRALLEVSNEIDKIVLSALNAS